MNFYPSSHQFSPSSPIKFLISPPPDSHLKFFCLYCRQRIPQVDYFNHFNAHNYEWHPCNEHYVWFGRHQLGSHVDCLIHEAVRYNVWTNGIGSSNRWMMPVSVAVCEHCGFCAEDEERLQFHFYWRHRANECQTCHDVVLGGEIGRGEHQSSCDLDHFMPPWTPPSFQPFLQSSPGVPSYYQSTQFLRSIGGTTSSPLRIHSIEGGPIAPILRQADVPTPISYSGMEHLTTTGRMMDRPMMAVSTAAGGGQINRSIDGQQTTAASVCPIDPLLARVKRVPPVFILRAPDSAATASINANATPTIQPQHQPAIAVSQSRIDRSAGGTPQRPLQSILKRRSSPSFDARSSSCHSHARFNHTPPTSPDHHDDDDVGSSSGEIEEEDWRVEDYFPTIKRPASSSTTSGGVRNRPTRLFGGSRRNYQLSRRALRTSSTVDHPQPASTAAVDQRQEESIPPPKKRGRPPKTERTAVKMEKKKTSLRSPAIDMAKYEYACKICDRVSVYKESMQKHVNRVHQIPFERREQWYEVREKQPKREEDGADDRRGEDTDPPTDGEVEEDGSTMTNGDVWIDDGDDHQIASTSASTSSTSSMASREGISKNTASKK